MKAPAMNPYLKTKIMTASPQQLRLMLYDGCLRFCQQGRDAMARKDYETSYESVARAKRIVLELQNSLNPAILPELCDRLSALYSYLFRQLVQANVGRNPQTLDEVIELVGYERETWQMLIEKGVDESQPASPPEPVGRTTSPLSRSA